MIATVDRLNKNALYQTRQICTKNGSNKSNILLNTQVFDMKNLSRTTLSKKHHSTSKYKHKLYASGELVIWIGMSSVLRPCQHNIGHMGDGFYRSKDSTNSIKVLKENLQRKTTQRTKKTQNTHKIVDKYSIQV